MARRVVAVARPGVAGVDGGELGCGCRSSVVHENPFGARGREKQRARDALRGLTNVLDSPGDQMVTGAASTASSAAAEVRPWCRKGLRRVGD